MSQTGDSPICPVPKIREDTLYIALRCFKRTEKQIVFSKKIQCVFVQKPRFSESRSPQPPGEARSCTCRHAAFDTVHCPVRAVPCRLSCSVPYGLALEEDARLLPLRLGHMAPGVAKAHGADNAVAGRHMEAFLDLGLVHEGLGKADPAGTQALGMGGQHDVGRAEACVVHVPVRGRVAVDDQDIVGIVEDIVGVAAKPLLVLGKPGQIA